MLEEGIEVRDGYTFLKSASHNYPAQAVELLHEAMNTCVEHKHAQLLVDAYSMDDPHLSFMERVTIVIQIADFWDRRIRVALITSIRNISPDDIVVVALSNRGIPFQFVNTKSDGRAWLNLSTIA